MRITNSKLNYDGTDQSSMDQGAFDHGNFDQGSPGSAFARGGTGLSDYLVASCGNITNLAPHMVGGAVIDGAISQVGAGISVVSAANANGTTTDTVSFAGSGVVFNNTFTANVTQAYKNCIISAEQKIASTWTNSVTINEEFDAQAQGLNGNLASNSFFIHGVTYSALKAALTSLASTENNTYLQQAVANLPSNDPSGGKLFELALPYARMLGLTSSSQNPDDTVTLNTSYSWSYGQDVINTLEHEISEGGMGRVGGLGDQNSFWSVMDLFRYNAAGQLDETDGRDGMTTYFSYNGGKTLSALSFNNEYNSSGVKVNGGDTADFTQQDVFGTGSPGETNTLSLTDIQLMDTLGWNQAFPSNPAPPAGTTRDMIMSQSGTGNYEIYDIGQNAILAAYHLTQISSPWQVVTLGAFNGTDTSDMLMRNGSTGEFNMYEISNNSVTAVIDMGNVGTAWSVAGFGDFSGNANEVDMLMRESTGEFELYDINNGQFTGFHDMGNVGVEWTIAGFGDFSGNANEVDMLMRDSNNGQFELYDISNNQFTGFHNMGNVGLEWSVVGFGNFSGNANETDMLMRNSNNGEFELYDMSGNQFTGFHDMGNVNTSWVVVGYGDFSGNANETDMLMRNGNNGEFELFDISHNQFTGSHDMGNVGLEWSVVGFGNFSGNANETDMLMRNSNNGEFELYDIGGNQFTGFHDLGNVGVAWSVNGIAVDPPSGGAGASGTEPPVSNGQGNATTLVSMSDTAAILGAGGAAAFINDGGNHGSSGGPLPDPSGTLANWLTEAMYSGVSSNLADQAVLSPTLSFGSNGDVMALADNLQNVAQSAGINTSFKKL